MNGYSAASAALALDPDELRSAIDQHAIVAVTDHRGEITYANDRFCAISGYSRSELIGQNHRILNSGYHPPEFFRELWLTIASGRVWHGEIRNRAKSGNIYWVATSIVPFMGPDGRPKRYLSIRTEITNRKRVEEQLHTRTEALTRSNAMLAEFAYAASHDLQEPVRGMIRCADLLLTRYSAGLDAKGLQLVEHIASNAARMRDLIRGLLDLAQVEQPVLPRRTVDCNALLGEVMDQLGGLVAESGARVTAEALPAVVAQPAQLASVFQNLITNAIRFRSQQPAEVHISASETADGWEFVIRDNGIGVDPSQTEEIFRMFQKGTAAQSTSGTGMGLAICRRIVESHGGRIWVEPAPDGSAFHFTIASSSGGLSL